MMNLRAVPHRELKSKSGEAFSCSAAVGELAGIQDVSIRHEILAPGRRASGRHSHSLCEEWVLVLEGAVVAHVGDRSVEMSVGDFLGFPPGEAHAHTVENRSEREARLLVVASKQPDDRVIYS